MSPRPNLMAVFQDGPLTNSVRRDPNLVRPGGNLTGFTSFEFSIGTKWLEALKQTATATRVAVLVNSRALPDLCRGIVSGRLEFAL